MAVNENRLEASHRFGRVSFELVPQLNHRLFPRRIVVQNEAWKGWRPFPFPPDLKWQFHSLRRATATPAPAAQASPRCSGRPIPARPISRSSACSRIRRGIIGLPLRLLAREVYNKCVDRVGAENVALITGEEKIKPPNPRFWVATIEAMPRDLDVAFVAIDEVQLGADLERGHVFTDRMLNRRGREETLVLGAATVRPMVERLLPGAHVLTRPRLSQLTFSGEKKLTRLPRRSAVVAFSAEEVYAIAELIRRQRGGAAVVLGALSPRTRNAQVALYQSGDVEYLVATDAIGMGLNLDVDHLAFASDRKFDGYQFRKLNPSELAQIAGRAGRATRDGTFGTTGRCPPFETEHRAGAGEPFVRAAQAVAVAQHRARFHLGRRAAGVALRGAEGKRAHPRAGRRGHPGARPRRRATTTCARSRPRRRRWRGCGRSARFPTTARSRPRRMPSWR